MKISFIITLLFAALFFVGCASNETASTTEAVAPGAADNVGAAQKTAYEGSTGSGLLMERYKSGEIEGYRK